MWPGIPQEEPAAVEAQWAARGTLLPPASSQRHLV